MNIETEEKAQKEKIKLLKEVERLLFTKENIGECKLLKPALERHKIEDLKESLYLRRYFFETPEGEFNIPLPLPISNSKKYNKFKISASSNEGFPWGKKYSIEISSDEIDKSGPAFRYIEIQAGNFGDGPKVYSIYSSLRLGERLSYYEIFKKGLDALDNFSGINWNKDFQEFYCRAEPLENQ